MWDNNCEASFMSSGLDAESSNPLGRGKEREKEAGYGAESTRKKRELFSVIEGQVQADLWCTHEVLVLSYVSDRRTFLFI